MMMVRDALLHFAHFMCIFILASLLAAEAFLMRPSLTREQSTQLQLVDRWYGVFAGLVIVTGLLLLFFGAKGASYYAHSAVFWTKMAVFVAIALLSIVPTMTFSRWDSRRAPDGSVLLDDNEYRRLRTLLWIQIALFTLLPLCAALMANGISRW